MSQRHGSANPDPDPPQNVIDPQQCWIGTLYIKTMHGWKFFKRQMTLPPWEWWLYFHGNDEMTLLSWYWWHFFHGNDDPTLMGNGNYDPSSMDMMTLLSWDPQKERWNFLLTRVIHVMREMAIKSWWEVATKKSWWEVAIKKIWWEVAKKLMRWQKKVDGRWQ